MPRKFKEARQINKFKVIEAAAKLGVSQPTLSAWEGERKSPGLDNLENMADLYGVSTDYLLGRSEQGGTNPDVPIPVKSLPIFHLLTVESCLPRPSYFRNLPFRTAPH